MTDVRWKHLHPDLLAGISPDSDSEEESELRLRISDFQTDSFLHMTISETQLLLLLLQPLSGGSSSDP